MPPPIKTQLQLLGLPNEIFDQITTMSFEHGFVEDGHPQHGVLVKASNESGDFKLTWEPAWVSALLLVCEKLQDIAQPFIVRCAKLEASERKRGPEMLAKPYDPAEEADTPLNLDHFPAYLSKGATVLTVRQSKIECQFKTDILDISILPDLKKLEIAIGDFCRHASKNPQGISNSQNPASGDRKYCENLGTLISGQQR